MRYTIYILVLFLFEGCTSDLIEILEPVPFQKVNFEEEIWGQIIQDPYRHMENLEDSTVIGWMKKQTAFATKHLDAIKSRDKLLNQMLEFDSRTSSFITKTNITNNGEYFYLKKGVNQEEFRLYYRKEYSEEEIEIFKPNQIEIEKGKKNSISYIKPSWDGKKIVVGLTNSGKEISTLIVIDVPTKRIASVRLDGAWPDSYLGVSWLPDNSGFMYLRFPITDSKAEGFKENTETVLYKLGSKSDEIIPIIGPQITPQLNLPSQGSYTVARVEYQSDTFIIAYQATVENFWNAYYAPISQLANPKKINWQSLFTSKDRIVTRNVVQKKDRFIFKSGKSSDNYTINFVPFSNIDFNNSSILIQPKEDEVLKSFAVVKDSIFYTTTKSGVVANFYKYDGASQEKINLPEVSGNASLFSINPFNENLWISTSGWLSNLKRYKYENQTFNLEPLSKRAPYPEFENFIVEEVEVTSHDGKKVPLTLIYDKDIKLNGENPAIFYGYGAYGTSLGPFYAPSFLTWVMEGGVFCIPHVRGGGVKGDAWHKGGLKKTKPNTWKDLIACIEYVQDKKFTSPEKTSIYSMSAGGIMVGKVMTERPDLITAVIAEVAMMHPLRHESRSDGGGSNVKEYGSIKDSLEFTYLKNMDAYHSLKKNNDYPAVYLTAGYNDPRVPAWIPGKFAAKLQNCTASENPVLFNVDFEGGHGSTLDENTKFYLEYANVFAFALWQSGHSEYKL